MALRIICMCGYVIQGDDNDALWRGSSATWASYTLSWSGM